MGGGGGHIMDMLKRLQANRNARTSNKTEFKQHGHLVHTSDGKSIDSALRFKTVSPEKQQHVIREMRLKLKTRRKRNLLLTLFVFLLFATMLALPLLFLPRKTIFVSHN